MSGTWRRLKIKHEEYPEIYVTIEKDILEPDYNQCRLYIRNLEYRGLDDFIYTNKVLNTNLEMCRELVILIRDSWDDIEEYFYHDIGEIELL